MCDYACFLGYRHVVYEIAVGHNLIISSAKIVNLFLFFFAELFFEETYAGFEFFYGRELLLEFLDTVV